LTGASCDAYSCRVRSDGPSGLPDLTFFVANGARIPDTRGSFRDKEAEAAWDCSTS